MKNTRIFASLALCLLLGACTTTTSSQMTAYDSSGAPVATRSSSSSRSDTMEAVGKAGTAVKDGAVRSYEWTKDKTVKGYNWVKEKVQDEGTEKAATAN